MGKFGGSLVGSGSALRLSALAALLLVGDVGCGAAGGSDCAPACGQKSSCTKIGSSATALEALNAGLTAAPLALGQGPKWVGAIEGLQILHDGTPSQTPAAQVGNTSVYVSGWVFKYCSGMDAVVYGAGPPKSSAQKDCGDFDCSAIATYTLPAIDSPQAIAAAFPSDPASTLYTVDLNLLAGARTWQIQSPTATVTVDADTGAVVP